MRVFQLLLEGIQVQRIGKGDILEGVNQFEDPVFQVHFCYFYKLVIGDNRFSSLYFCFFFPSIWKNNMHLALIPQITLMDITILASGDDKGLSALKNPTRLMMIFIVHHNL